ncbi:hypothetical protein WJX75_005493 [Coccomyxa subellipsoidea]|uniref:N-terminal nucleophile aminohydrolase n=1 Tax=Coccomyxa subellipsoidea TaxID=248742 RepID=A0ABR2YYB7_9CHLO
MLSQFKSATKLSSALAGLSGNSTAWSSSLMQTCQRSLHNDYRGTTVLSVRKGDQVIIMADGQVTRNSEIIKPNVRKVRSMFDGKVIGGFAGATADAFTLFERLETQLETNSGHPSA